MPCPEQPIGLYAEVVITDAGPYDDRGRRGAVLGISEEGGRVYGYAVQLHGERLVQFFETACVRPTGVVFAQSDFY